MKTVIALCITIASTAALNAAELFEINLQIHQDTSSTKAIHAFSGVVRLDDQRTPLDLRTSTPHKPAAVVPSAAFVGDPKQQNGAIVVNGITTEGQLPREVEFTVFAPKLRNGKVQQPIMFCMIDNDDVPNVRFPTVTVAIATASSKAVAVAAGH